MSIQSFLFGEKGTPETVQDVAPAEFQGTRETTAGGLKDFLANQPQAEGPFAAAITTPESGFVSQAVKQAGAPIAGRDALTRTLTEGGAENPFLAKSIEAAQRPILEQFQESRLGLRGAFARAGQRGPGSRGSSAFKKALSKEGRTTSRALGTAAMGITSADQTRRRTQQQAAIATAIGVEQADIARTHEALSAAGIPRNISDDAISRAAQQNSAGLTQLLNAIKIGGAAGRATIINLAGKSPGDGALSDIAGIVGGLYAGPAGAAVGSAAGQYLEGALG